MTAHRRYADFFVLIILALVTVPGCGGSETTEKEAVEEEQVLLEPFDPPTLAELDAEVEWEDQRVIDSLAELRALQATETPLVSVEEALKLHNDSPEINTQILSALGRLPAEDNDVDWEATITRHLGGDVRSTNPIMASAAVESEVNGMCGFGMFSFDWKMRPFASSESVVSWQSSKDMLYDKVVMRKDLTWSDGQPITAHDVVFSFKTIMNSKVPVPAVRSGTDQLRWVEAYDDQTLVFFHKKATPVNVWNINFPVIPRHIYEKSLAEDFTLQNSPYHVKYENQPVTGGAYEFVSRQRGQEIVLRRRESYYIHDGKQVRDKPYFKTIRFRIIEDSNTALLALQSGNIDESILTPEQWTTQTTRDDYYERNTKASGVEWVSFHFCWNIKSPFFDDVRVRKAMSYAFDYDEMLSKLCYGLYEPCNGVFHKENWAAPKDAAPPYKRDLARAEALLDEAGWEDHDGDGIRDKEINGRPERFEFTILTSNSAERIAMCNLLKQNLDQIGIVCHVRPLDFAVLMEKTQNHEFQAFHGGWGTGTDPYTLKNIFKTDEERNYGSYSNVRVDELFDEGMKEFDQDKRARIYSEIHKILYEEQPYTWLYFRNSFYGFNKQLRGYKFSPRGPYSYSPGFGSIWKAVP